MKRFFFCGGSKKPAANGTLGLYPGTNPSAFCLGRTRGNGDKIEKRRKVILEEEERQTKREKTMEKEKK